ncbi:hypothetical protein F511_02332 [Dorcoceras hygrometricum]|uniref:Uncharacterized protein n=1 Tax=Dorcoceras hygrometricum TaxID=472368 RepID=A0A2Z7CF70_9LAMI|nr:hypothetical protein F511_02332 [Dorcoceras hygrometricum]
MSIDHLHSRMQSVGNSDPTTLSYWLTWRVLLCAISVLLSLLVGSYLIWKYESSDCLESDEERSSRRHTYYNRSWNPCLKQIHPIFLMSFRIIAFFLLLVALCLEVAVHGFELFYYYTQWTFSLCVIYFGVGSCLSIHGCFQHPKLDNHSKSHVPEDMEKGLYAPLSHGEADSGVRLCDRLNHPGKGHVLLTSEFWDYLLQVLFQV